MKKILIALLFFGSLSYGQTKGISYQALIIDPIEQELPGFNNNQAPLTNKNICLKFSFIDELNSLEYEEIFTTTTDDVGMVNLIIGTEDRTGGYASSFEDITWSSLPKNLKVDLSVNDGCSNFIEISNAPFTAVPYALFALNTENTPLVLDNEAEIILLKSLLATTQLGAGLNTDGTYSPNASSNFITGATSLNNADTILDGQVKNNETTITTNTSDIATNAAAVTNNTISINTNTSDIAVNSSNITTNTTGIADNTTAINERVKIVDIVDDLTTGGTMLPLSAEQGKVLKNLVDTTVNILVEDDLTSTSTTNALSANQGRELKGITDNNSTDIATNTSGIATNVTDIGNNATNIAANTSAIATNVTDIGNNASAITAINTLVDGKIYLGDVNGAAQEVTLSGDVTMSNAGVTSIGANKVLSSMIDDGTIVVGDLANDAVTNVKIATGVDVIKLANGSVTNTELQYIGTLSADAQTQIDNLSSNGSTNASAITAINTLVDGKIYLGDVNGAAQEVTLSGDVTLANEGTVTIENDAVSYAKVQNIVTANRVLGSTTAGGIVSEVQVATDMIANDGVTNAKLDKANIPLSGFGAATADVALGANKLTGVSDPTAAQDAATKAYVDAAIPVGGIIMWYGALIDIPSNWQLCDGSAIGSGPLFGVGNNTPDLTNRFIIGADSSLIPNTIGGSSNNGATIGSVQEGTNSFIQVVTNINVDNRPPYYALAYIIRIE